MNESSQLALRQSETTVATTSSSVTLMSSLKDKENKRLQLYNSLFGQAARETCDQTGLQLTSSLNYSLYTFLHLCDIHWVLAMIDIDEKREMNEKYGYHNVSNKINQIGTVIKKFCDNDQQKLKGFVIRCSDDEQYGDGDGVVFALLMYCYPKLIICEKYIAKLMKKIECLTNVTVSIGIAKMNRLETFEKWKHRALKNMKNGENTTETRKNTFYSDIGIEFVDSNTDTSNGDEKKEEKKAQERMAKWGSKEEFHSKMKQIANNENYEWVVAIMAIDDFDSFIFLNGDDNVKITLEISKIETEMYHLFDMFGNGVNRNEMKYFGYKLNHNASKYGLIGSSRLIEDDLGMVDDWYERINNNLKLAKQSGKNQVRFGSGVNNNDDDDDDKLKTKVNQVESEHESTDDVIEMKSLQAIEVYPCTNVFYFGCHCTLYVFCVC